MLVLALCAIWLGLFIWYQLGAGSIITWIALPTLIAWVCSILYTRLNNDKRPSHAQNDTLENNALNKGNVVIDNIKPSKVKKRQGISRLLTYFTAKKTALFIPFWLAGLATFLSLTPKDDRQWQKEVEKIVSYERSPNNPDIVTLHNVRDFTWHSTISAPIDSQNIDTPNIDSPDVDSPKIDSTDNLIAYNTPELKFSTDTFIKQRNADSPDTIAPTERWGTRQLDLSDLTGVDIINSYWMGPQIGHTLITFRFNNDRPVAFSFEIRKEKGEKFSALAGFFRKYELSLTAAEERDIIYARSNWRGEQVYLFPLDNLTQAQVRELFEHYLHYADTLQARPEWYNTLINNCTNLIFNMARRVDSERFPLDYRIWLTGHIPEYLYDNGVLPKTDTADNEVWDMQTWFENAYINPKTATFTEHDNHSLTAYSKLIRQDLPRPDLDSN